MPRHSTEAPQPIAYSYIRFSTPEQRKGDSLRRQTDDAAAWCKRNKVHLDESTTLHDLGKSAYTGAHRDNPDRHALASFLKLVDGGRVPQGSYLIIENLDRLTREDIWSALDLVSSLLKAGVRIVQLKPVEQVIEKTSGPMVAMMAIMELSRGHSESKMKSERVGATWGEKLRLAREGKQQPPRKRDGRVTESLTNRLPAWVEDRRGKLTLIPKATAAIRLIFQLAAAGYGAKSIVQKLQADKVPHIGSMGRWTRTYVSLILRDRRVIGEHQPRRGKGGGGLAIKGYYPCAVLEDEWNAARAGVAQRTSGGRGNGGSGRVNVFAGLLNHARDGDKYVMTQRRSIKGGKLLRQFSVLVNSRGDSGEVPSYSLPYDVFETAVLSCLQEINPNDILNGDQPPDETATLAGELVAVEAELADAAAFMDANGFSPTIGKRVTDLEARKAKLAHRLADARQKAAHPLSESWGECQSLTGALSTAMDPRDARLRLRTALRRIVTDIRLLVVRRGLVRVAAAQIWFAGNKRCRDYVVWYRPGCNRHRPIGSWSVRSLASVVTPGDLDLRRRDHAARLEKALASVV
jgi:DNA invertase Pin-like site-specific DNA recombinase